MIALDEPGSRREGWTEGKWITLADGQAWCFPPHDKVPGHREMAERAAKEYVGSVLRLANIEAVKNACKQADSGNLEPIARNIGLMLGLYQVGYAVACNLLTRNYRLTADDCAALMPFDYQLSEVGDPNSKVNTATPQLLAMANEIRTIVGVDIKEELDRIGASN